MPALNVGLATFLAECSEIAYKARWQAAEAFKERGFSEVHIYELGGAEAFLAFHPGLPARRGLPESPFAVVAFRGTERDYKDIFADITWLKRTIDYVRRYRVHGGFLSALNQVWGHHWDPAGLSEGDETGRLRFTAVRQGPEGVSERLVRWIEEDREEGGDMRVFLTGHSLGGAQAILAAYRLFNESRIAPTGVYTFGAPRAVGPALASAWPGELAVSRVENGMDAVPMVPLPFMGFRHVGRRFHLSKKGELQEVPSANNLVTLLRGIGEWLVTAAPALAARALPFGLLVQIPFPMFQDHSIVRYRGKLSRL